jgi:hypothetical protein
VFHGEAEASVLEELGRGSRWGGRSAVTRIDGSRGRFAVRVDLLSQRGDFKEERRHLIRGGHCR